MFVFGEPKDIARTFIEAVEALSPGLGSVPVRDQTEEELKNTIVILRMAIKRAHSEGADEETRGILLHLHDNVFEGLAETSESFCERWNQGLYNYPDEKSRFNKMRYDRMVKKAEANRSATSSES